MPQSPQNSIQYAPFSRGRRAGDEVNTTSLHVSDGTKKFATIETKTIENGEQITNPVTVTRYQYDNHLGSACLELDEDAAIISYEEYHPFGTTSYRSGSSETEVSLKRYKYVGKERDEETGLYYYGARYYAAWIARFVSVDPLQHKYPHYTPYQYAGNKPITYIDLDGLEEAKKDEEKPIQKLEPKTINKLEIDNIGLPEKLLTNDKPFYDRKYKGLKFAGYKEYELYSDYKKEVQNRIDLKDSESPIYVGIMKELTNIENQSVFTFKLRYDKNVSSTSGGGNIRYSESKREVDINIASYGSFTTIQRIAHEFKHADQLLNGKMDLTYLGSYGNSYDPYDEHEAYNRQNLFHLENRSETKIDNVEDFVFNLTEYDAIKNRKWNTTVTDIDEYRTGGMKFSNDLAKQKGLSPRYIYNVK